jgi:hypothetical protein
LRKLTLVSLRAAAQNRGMCNCGHDVDDRNEADSLKKKATVTAAAAACLGGIPAIFSTPGPAHHAIVYGVIALQVGFITRALFLIRQRKQMLACNR